jgi:hypothetical protein
MPWATFVRLANRGFAFAVLTIAGAFAIASCAQNAHGISPVAAKSAGAVASIGQAAHGGSETATARGPSAVGGSGGGATPAPAANSSSTACPTQGEGGDDLPALCAPPPSSPGPPHVQGPATITTVPTAPPCTGLTVESVSPSRGAEVGGDTVTISGAGFSSSQQVLFGDEPVETLTVESATEISVTTPPGPPGGGTVKITIDCSGMTFSFGPAVMFTYVTSPAAPVGTPSSTPATLSPSSQAS